MPPRTGKPALDQHKHAYFHLSFYFFMYGQSCSTKNTTKCCSSPLFCVSLHLPPHLHSKTKWELIGRCAYDKDPDTSALTIAVLDCLYDSMVHIFFRSLRWGNYIRDEHCVVCVVEGRST